MEQRLRSWEPRVALAFIVKKRAPRAKPRSRPSDAPSAGVDWASRAREGRLLLDAGRWFFFVSRDDASRRSSTLGCFVLLHTGKRVFKTRNAFCIWIISRKNFSGSDASDTGRSQRPLLPGFLPPPPDARRARLSSAPCRRPRSLPPRRPARPPPYAMGFFSTSKSAKLKSLHPARHAAAEALEDRGRGRGARRGAGGPRRTTRGTRLRSRARRAVSRREPRLRGRGDALRRRARRGPPRRAPGRRDARGDVRRGALPRHGRRVPSARTPTAECVFAHDSALELAAREDEDVRARSAGGEERAARTKTADERSSVPWTWVPGDGLRSSASKGAASGMHLGRADLERVAKPLEVALGGGDVLCEMEPVSARSLPAEADACLKRAAEERPRAPRKRCAKMAVFRYRTPRRRRTSSACRNSRRRSPRRSGPRGVGAASRSSGRGDSAPLGRRRESEIRAACSGARRIARSATDAAAEKHLTAACAADPRRRTRSRGSRPAHPREHRARTTSRCQRCARPRRSWNWSSAPARGGASGARAFGAARRALAAVRARRRCSPRSRRRRRRRPPSTPSSASPRAHGPPVASRRRPRRLANPPLFSPPLAVKLQPPCFEGTRRGPRCRKPRGEGRAKTVRARSRSRDRLFAAGRGPASFSRIPARASTPTLRARVGADAARARGGRRPRERRGRIQDPRRVVFSR